MGSAQPITDPFLAFIRDVIWDGEVPSIQDAVFAVYWVLSHAISVNPGGVNWPIHIATLHRRHGKKLKAEEVSQSDLEMHGQMLEAAKEYFKAFPEKFRLAATEEGIEPVPKPV